MKGEPMARKAKVQLAAQLYTLREYLKNPKDIARTMKRVRKLGYEHAQISGLGPIEDDELRKIMDDAGVKPIGAHIGLDLFQNELSSVVKTCHVLGIGYVAIPWMPADSITTATAWKKAARDFSRLGKTLRAEGIILQYHNHAFEFQKYGGRKGIGGKTGLEILYENSDPQYLQAEIDVAWVARGGGDPAEWCRNMKGRLDQVHIKDFAMLNAEPNWTEAGEGNLNMPAILKACKAAGVKDYIVEQDTCVLTQNPFRSLEISYNNLQAMGLK